MDIEQLKKDLSVCEEEISGIRVKLDAQRATIVDKSKPIVHDAIRKKVEEEVMKNTDLTMQLGKEQLSELKSKLTVILDGNDSFLDDLFGEDTYWTHINYVLPNGYVQDYLPSEKRDMARNHIHDVLKIAYGQAGNLLIAYEYAKAGSEYDHYSEWAPKSYTGIVNMRDVKSCRIPELPKEFVELIGQYENLLATLHKKMCLQKNLQKSVAEHNAKSLWDSL